VVCGDIAVRNFLNETSVISTKTATRSCRTWKRAVHVYSPGVAATRHVWPTVTAPAGTALLPLLLQLMVCCYNAMYY